MLNKYNAPKNHLRIIAGKLRNRKISFNADNLSLRPSLDRVRETVFNWLVPDIVGANCLDLFAGSGIFGFEAYSRGANSVSAIEADYTTYQNIVANKLKLNLNTASYKILQQDALLFLANNKNNKKFNIIFLDPPYLDFNLLITSIELLIKNNWLANNSKLYIETKNSNILDLSQLPLTLIKSSKTTKINFYLYEKK